MVQPIDYTVPMQNPLAAFEQAANFGMGIQQNQQALEANRLKIEAEKAGQERLRQVGELVMKAASPDATIDDMRAVMMTAASPEQLKAYESKLSAMTTEQKKAEFTPALQVKYALNSGKPDLAKKILMDRATALENSGDGAGAQRARAMAETIDDDGGVTVSADIASKLAFDSEIGAPALKAMQDELLFKPKLQEAEGKAKREGSLATTAAAEAALAPERAKAELGQVNANIRRINSQIANDAKRLSADIANANRTFELESKKAGVTGTPKMTEAQAKDMLNAQRLARAGKVTADLELGGYNPTMSISDTKARQYKAAKREFADAVLRSTTGAAATKDEIANAEKMYFPEFGDSPDVRLQKSEMRAAFVQDMFSRAGPGMAGKQAPSMKTQKQPASASDAALLAKYGVK